ncbi:MAG: NUDIX hydrolase [Flavobacteriales bacterium]|nr:NUDIX hydrolase [Flavobacteriales bacterium]
MENKQELSKFNVRVYALFVNEKEEVLVSDEIIRTKQYSKFPGGGLELGESPLECLRRESREEMNQQIEIVRHFYTTDQFVRSYFRPWEQVICIYYFAKILGPPQFRISSKKFDFDPNLEGDQESFRWQPIAYLQPNDFQFLIDAHVVGLLRKEYGYF